jgi:hypothetical protein
MELNQIHADGIEAACKAKYRRWDKIPEDGKENLRGKIKPIIAAYLSATARPPEEV